MDKHKYINFLWLVLLLAFPLHCLGADGKKGDPIRGATEWANNCSRCHHMRNPQDNRDDIWVTIVTHMRVRAGLTGQQARNIVAYLQSANFSPVIASRDQNNVSSGLSGQQIYSGTCIACHGADGNGAIPGVPVLAERLTKSDEILLKHMKEGFQSPGSTLAMPARGGNLNLTNKDLENVLGYLRQEFGK